MNSGNKGLKEEKLLKESIAEARRLMNDAGSCHTRADRAALADMVNRAERALDGVKNPFTRNREFMNPGDSVEISFAYDRFTMAPAAFEKGKVYGHYGLKEAVRWFAAQDMARWTQEQLEGRRQEVLERVDTLLGQAVCGGQIGEYDRSVRDELERHRDILAQASGAGLPEALRSAVDAFHAMKFSRRLSSDKERYPVLLLSDGKRGELPGQIESNALVRVQFQKIRENADMESLEESRIGYEQIWEQHGYTELNKMFSIWGDTGRTVNFRTPRGTKSARLSFALPSAENDASGLGHITVTGINIFAADSPEVKVPNADFAETGADREDILHWRVMKKGSAVCRKEQVGLYLCNPTASDEVTVVCGELLPLAEGSGYTLFFRAKQDGKFRQGFRAVLEFLDGNGGIIDRFTYVHNRKSVLPTGHKALRMQCNALMYWLSGGEEYAQKAKYDMLAFLNDFCQGAEYWMVYNARPEGCDAYGAVQAGRIMCSVASAYSLIVRAGVFLEEEYTFFEQMVDYLLHYCLDMRDRMSMAPRRAQEGSSNWQTDMCIGVAALMMVLPKYPDRKTWLYNAEAVLEAQLSTNLNADGSWPESIRYHHAALEHFATFASIWEQETGENWLLSTRLKDMFAYTVHTVTPPYEYFGGRIGTPPFGDHRLSGGDELGIYGLYVDRIARTDKKLADEMYQIWRAAGCPVKAFSGESVVAEHLLYTDAAAYSIDDRNTLQLGSTCDYPDSGIYVFRGNGASGKENYLAVMSSPQPIGHGHLDQGSFILYYHNYPVVMDSGIEGYFDASTQWHLSSYSHACLQFAATQEEQRSERVREGAINLNAGNYSLDRGWLDAPRVSKVLRTEITAHQDSISMEIAHPCGREKGVHRRTICFEKESGVVTIEDVVENYDGKLLFSLPMAVQSAVVEGNTVRAVGFYLLQVDVEFLTPVERIVLEKGRTTPFFPAGEETPMLLYVRAEALAQSGVKVRIMVREGRK